MERGSCITLGALIKVLEQFNPDRKISSGFGAARSYRGYYEDLAFAPKGPTTVRQMLAEARRAVGRTFEAYKGGHYQADEETLCWLADWGQLGEPLQGRWLLFDVLSPIPQSELDILIELAERAEVNVAVPSSTLRSLLAAYRSLR